MTQGYEHRIRCKALLDKVIPAEQAVDMIKDGMTLGISGFTITAEPKVILKKLAEKVENTGEKIGVHLFSGASVGDECDGALARAGSLLTRIPYQSDKDVRNNLNTVGGVRYIDQHLSMSPQDTRYGFYGDVDFAIIEACAITEEGGIVPTTSLGSSPTFVQAAKKVLVELNTVQMEALEGIHDIYTPLDPPNRQPIPLTSTGQRIGTTYIPCDPEKIAGIVITDIPDNVKSFKPIDDTSQAIAENIIGVLKNEVAEGRLPANLLPLQSGVGSVANAVLAGLANSGFKNLSFYSEVIQDSALQLIKKGVLDVCSGTSITPSPEGLVDFVENIEFYKKHIVLRPQEISNNPEIARRLGVIAMNTAIEADIYGNVNSTHIMGTRMMNGIGGSGDFARSSFISIFMTASTAKGGEISSIVPMVSHVDHTEHDVRFIITEQGVADLRYLCPRERALAIINNCSHPEFRPMLMDYYQRALKETPAGKAHTPHILTEALSWHDRFNKTGTMKIK